MPLSTCITWALISLAVACVAALSSRRIRLRWLPSLLVAMLAAGATLALLYLFSSTARPTPVAVTIISPASGSVVTENRVRVTGKVSRPEARVTLVVRSETALKWWAQAVVTPERDEDGLWKWSINAHLGTREAGVDENFQIIALASADSWLFNLITGRAISENSTFTTIPLWEQSEPVVVRRMK